VSEPGFKVRDRWEIIAIGFVIAYLIWVNHGWSGYKVRCDGSFYFCPCVRPQTNLAGCPCIASFELVGSNYLIGVKTNNECGVCEVSLVGGFDRSTLHVCSTGGLYAVGAGTNPTLTLTVGYHAWLIGDSGMTNPFGACGVYCETCSPAQTNGGAWDASVCTCDCGVPGCLLERVCALVLFKLLDVLVYFDCFHESLRWGRRWSLCEVL